jgi:phosphatidylinositol glycan class T
VPPPGLELRVAFLDNKTTSARDPIKLNQNLQALGHSLSSLVAASVPALVDHGVWAAPIIGWWQRWSSQAESGNRGTTNAVQRRQMYGALTQEGPCVENLSAWLKMLACRGGGEGRGGLAGILQAEDFVASPLHSLQLTLDTFSSGTTTGTRGIALTLGFTMLQQGNKVDTLRKAIQNHYPCPAASSSFMLLPTFLLEKEASLERNIICAPVHAAMLHDTKEIMQLCTLTRPPPPDNIDDTTEAIRSPVCLQTPKSRLWNLDLSSSMVPMSSQITTLSVNAFITSSMAGGETTTTVEESTNSTNTVLVHIMQMIPWEVSVRWHTLKISFNGIPLRLIDTNNGKDDVQIKKEEEEAAAAAAVVVWKNFQPAQPRSNAALIEILLKLPLANRTKPSTEEKENTGYFYAQKVHLQVEIKKKLLTIFDFPPDASRGIDVPPAVLTLVPPQELIIETIGKDSTSRGITSPHSLVAAALGCPPFLPQLLQQPLVLSRRSSPHLINLPIPDASMPFNVVCFTSTVMALAFGSALNAILLTKTPFGKKNKGGGIDDAEEEEKKRRRAIKLKLVRMVAVLVIVGITAVYMDKDLQRQVDAWLADVAALWPSAPGSHHPEL